MKLYRLNEYEWWAANSMEEAIAAAMEATGLPRDEATDDKFLAEADPQQVTVTLDEFPLHIAGDLKKVIRSIKPWEAMFKEDIAMLEKHSAELLAKCLKPAPEIMATMTEPGLVCSTEH